MYIGLVTFLLAFVSTRGPVRDSLKRTLLLGRIVSLLVQFGNITLKTYQPPITAAAIQAITIPATAPPDKLELLESSVEDEDAEPSSVGEVAVGAIVGKTVGKAEGVMVTTLGASEIVGKAAVDIM